MIESQGMHELMEGPTGVAQALARLLVRWLQRHNLFATTLAYVRPTSETVVLEPTLLKGGDPNVSKQPGCVSMYCKLWQRMISHLKGVRLKGKKLRNW